jgi:hypothetical protein
MVYNHFLGRKVAVGLGVETTPGTSVAPTTWIRLLNPDFHDMPTFIDNKSGLGRVEDSDDQALVKQMASGKLEGKITDISIGYILANIFGSWSSALHAGETTVYDATFVTSQSSTPPALTIVKKDGVENKRYSLGTLGDCEFSAVAGDWAKFTATAMSKIGVTGTDVPAFVVENEFTSKYITVKLAANIAGLGAALAIPLVSFKLKIDRKPADFTPLGAIDPAVFDTTSWTVTGEMVLRYDAATYHDLTFANTPQALSIALVNSDTTIGSTSKPGLVFTAPRARLNTWSVDSSLDKVIDQTIGFKANLDLTSGYMLQAVLTNTKATYA